MSLYADQIAGEINTENSMLIDGLAKDGLTTYMMESMGMQLTLCIRMRISREAQDALPSRVTGARRMLEHRQSKRSIAGGNL